MKGLLHSKIFKANLKKWLFMYVGVILLLTTVITYSKYVSLVNAGSGSVKIAKFSASVRPIEDGVYYEDCTDILNCYIGAYRPTSIIAFEFAIDLTNVDVESKLDLKVDVDRRYSIYSFQKDGEVISLTNTEKENGSYEGSWSLEKTYNNIEANTSGNKREYVYKIVVEYKYAGEVFGTEIIDTETIFDIVKVAYSLEQVTN